MLIQQTLIQYLLQKKNLCEIFKVLTIWGNINLFIRPQHHYYNSNERQITTGQRNVRFTNFYCFYFSVGTIIFEILLYHFLSQRKN